MSLLAQTAEGHGVHWLFHVFGGGAGGVVYLKIPWILPLYLGCWKYGENKKHSVAKTKALIWIYYPAKISASLPAEVKDIKLQVIRLEKSGVYFLLLDFVKIAATQFRKDLSISDTMQVMEGQFTVKQNELRRGLGNRALLSPDRTHVGFCRHYRGTDLRTATDRRRY